MIYLDYQATTPLAPEARAAMLPWLDAYANPHSPSRAGREAAAAIEAARERVLSLIHHPRSRAQSRDVRQPENVRQSERVSTSLGKGGEEGRLLFTSGATEAVNWAVKGAMARAPAGRRRLVTLATEHAAVLDTAGWLRDRGDDVVILPVGPDGLVDLDRAAAAIDGSTALVAAMLVNNEIGVIQPVAELSRLARAAGALFLCDAVQGYGRVPIPVDACDMIAISAHKIHGPKGVGALWLRDGVALDPLLHGGGQEGGLRSGTLSPMLCAGFGAAAAVAAARFDEDAAHVAALHDRLRRGLADWTLNGAETPRYPGNLNLRRDGVDASRLISELRELAFSSGSACASGSGRPSHVLAALGLSNAQTRSSIRLGFGRYTTADEIDRAAALIVEAAARQVSLAA